VYMSRDMLVAWRAGAPDPIRWIVKNIDNVPDWAREGEVSTAEGPQDHGRRGANRRGAAGARDDDAALLRSEIPTRCW
jgi:hypothetical protein